MLALETDLASAYRIAERLRVSVAQAPISTQRGDLRIMLSIGISEAKDETVNLACLFERADVSMYSAKHAGRNQVGTVVES